MEPNTSNEPAEKKPTPEAEKPSATPDPAVSGPLAQVETLFYQWFVAKAPVQIPKAGRDWIVQFGPWITLVIGILLLPALFALFGVIGLASGTMGMYGAYAGSAYASAISASLVWVWLAVFLLIIELIVIFISVPMLLKRQRKGWLLIFYVDILSLAYGIVSSLTSGYFNLGSLFFTLIAAAVGFYVLFQIRSSYKA